MVINKIRDIFNGVHASEYKGTKNEQQQQQQQLGRQVNPFNQRQAGHRSTDEMASLYEPDSVDKILFAQKEEKVKECQSCKIIASLVVTGASLLLFREGFKLVKQAKEENKLVDIRKGYVRDSRRMPPRFISTRSKGYLTMLLSPVVFIWGANAYFEWFRVPDVFEVHEKTYQALKEFVRKSM